MAHHKPGHSREPEAKKSVGPKAGHSWGALLNRAAQPIQPWQSTSPHRSTVKSHRSSLHCRPAAWPQARRSNPCTRPTPCSDSLPQMPARKTDRHNLPTPANLGSGFSSSKTPQKSEMPVSTTGQPCFCNSFRLRRICLMRLRLPQRGFVYHFAANHCQQHFRLPDFGGLNHKQVLRQDDEIRELAALQRTGRLLSFGRNRRVESVTTDRVLQADPLVRQPAPRRIALDSLPRKRVLRSGPWIQSHNGPVTPKCQRTAALLDASPHPSSLRSLRPNMRNPELRQIVIRIRV